MTNPKNQTEVTVYQNRIVECVGPYFCQYISEQSDKYIANEDLTSCPEESLEDFTETEEDVRYLKSLDPIEWKDQDHYWVLGLKNLRHRASAADIKSGYRRKVLAHHPDKRKARGEQVSSQQDVDDYFVCITKAWEILGDKAKRRSYDSVDPYIDDSLPSTSQINNISSTEEFFKLFRGLFKSNARWSERQPVPDLGDMNTSRVDVDNFYSFWYNLQSWREFSYQDEEPKEKGQDKDERKWIEKQNKAMRAKRKKEEMTRIRNLVDMAYNADPRIKKFIQEDKDKKEAQKRAKAEAVRARQLERERAQQEELDRQKKLEEEEKMAEAARKNALKAEREAQKRQLKKERKTLRECAKENDFYVGNSNERVKHMEAVEKMCELLELKELEELNKELKEGGREVFLNQINKMEKKLELERQKMIYKTYGRAETNGKDGVAGGGEGSGDKWTAEQVALLIKAVNLFPAGTNHRWEVVANFINQHCKEGQKAAKEVLSKAKELQSNQEVHAQLKTAANQKAFENFEKTKKADPVVESGASQRFDSTAQQLGLPTPWTSEEQRLLEQALKTYPSSTSDRWDRIAECIPTRNKKECMKRYKELAEMVKAKKAAESSLKQK